MVLALGLCAPWAGALEPDRRLTQYDLQAWTRADGLPQSSVFAVLPTRDGYVWLATQQCLARFDGHSFVRYAPSNEPAFRSGFITCLAEGPDGLWAGTLDGVVRRTGRAFRGLGTAEGLAHPRVRSLLVDRWGRLWVGTDGGLQRTAATSTSGSTPSGAARSGRASRSRWRSSTSTTSRPTTIRTAIRQATGA